jgi:hypothetical protein
VTNIEDFIRRGYVLDVQWRPYNRKYYARVHSGTAASSHNFTAVSLNQALKGLDVYLESLKDNG